MTLWIGNGAVLKSSSQNFLSWKCLIGLFGALGVNLGKKKIIHVFCFLAEGCEKISNLSFNPFPNKPWFLLVCSTSLLKTQQEKKKLLLTSNFSLSYSVFYPFQKLFAIFIKFEIVVCKLSQFGRV